MSSGERERRVNGQGASAQVGAAVSPAGEWLSARCCADVALASPAALSTPIIAA